MNRPGRQSVALTTAAFLVAVLPHLSGMPTTVIAAVLAGPAWRLAAMWRNWNPMPAVLRILFAFGGVGVVLVSHGTIWGRRNAASLLCVMLSAKMLESFRHRDLRLVAAVGFFVIAAQFLFSQRLIYLIYLLIACWLACLALLAIQGEEDGTPETAPSSIDWNRQTLRAGGMILLAIPLAVSLFMFFPRLAQPLWGLPDNAMDGRTGLSESMSPGSIANLYMDDSPAFRVTFAGPRPSHEQLYWRGPVLWNFDGTTWERFFYSAMPPTVLPEARGTVHDYEVQLEPHERRWLFALDYPTAVPPEATLTMDFQMLSRRPITRVTSYSVRSNPDFVDSPALSEQFRQAAVRLPDGRNPRARALAEQWQGEFGDDHLALAQHALQWFNSEPFFYSLDTLPLGFHGVDEFLFDLREGYCEYYASAFAVLMRAAGVPARIVTGYQGGYWQSGGEYLLVRNSDAHAWTEIWLEGHGWTRFDPTAAVAPSRIRDGVRSVAPARGLIDWPWLSALRNRYDRLQHLWNQQILGFDALQQQRLFKALGLPDAPPVVMVALMLIITSLLALAMYWATRRPRARPADEAQRLWQHWLKRLRHRKLHPARAETPLEFAGRVQALLHGSRPQPLRIADTYCRLHYGRGGEELLTRLRNDVQSFRTE